METSCGSDVSENNNLTKAVFNICCGGTYIEITVAADQNIKLMSFI